MFKFIVLPGQAFLTEQARPAADAANLEVEELPSAPPTRDDGSQWDLAAYGGLRTNTPPFFGNF